MLEELLNECISCRELSTDKYETKNIILWNHEPYYESPAHKSFEVEWEGVLHKATFYLDVDPDMPPIYGCVTKVIVNGFEYDPHQGGDPCDKMVFDITDAIRQGLNEIEFEFGWTGIRGLYHGTAYGVVTIEAEKIYKIKPTPPPETAWKYLPWIIGGIIGIAGIGVVAYLISELKR